MNMEMARKKSQGSKLYINGECKMCDWIEIFFTVDLIDNVCDSTQNQHGDQKGVFIITMIVIERNVRSIWSVVYQTQCIAL